MAGFKNLQALRHFVDGRPAMTERKDDRLWGGRFAGEPDAQFDRFQRSFAFDRRLLAYEIAVDRAWAKALEPVGIFTGAEVGQTLAALDNIAERAKSDPAWIDSFGANAEDVHHFVEKALVEELGPLGWKLHTGRSRNELIATDFRLFVMDAARETERSLENLLNTFLMQAKANLGVPMAGTTHLQHAQPILLSHFLLAHAEAFARDLTRLEHAATSADACPMGSGALAGNSFSIGQRHRQGAGVFPHHFKQPGYRKRSRFCARLSFRAGWDFDAPVPPRRRLCPLCVAGILLRDASRRIFHGQQPDATEKEPGLLGTDSRENRPHQRGARRLAHDAQRSAYGLSARPAGRQRRAFRRARPGSGHACGRDGSARVYQVQRRAVAGRGVRFRVARDGSRGLSRPQGHSVSPGARPRWQGPARSGKTKRSVDGAAPRYPRENLSRLGSRSAEASHRGCGARCQKSPRRHGARKRARCHRRSGSTAQQKSRQNRSKTVSVPSAFHLGTLPLARGDWRSLPGAAR